MATSLRDYLDFVVLWVRKRTGVGAEDLVIYPAMVRHCLCCNAGGSYAHNANGLCVQCCEDQVCLLCSESFVPTEASVGVFCPACWSQLETTWTTSHERGAALAEAKVRSTVTAARPRLGRCRHRA